MKKTMAIMAIHRRLRGIRVWVFRPKIISVEPVRAPRVRFTTWVRGRAAIAMPCAVAGREERGKKVPLKNSIGVMKRNMG